MDNKTLKALEKLGILSSRQVEMFALGGVSSVDGEPPVKEFYDPTNINEEENTFLPPLPALFSTPTPPIQGGYTAGNMQGNVLGVNPYYSQFDNNSNGLGFSTNGVGKELPISQQSTGQITVTNPPTSLSTLPTEAATVPTPQEGSNGFGSDYEAFAADAKKYQGKYRDVQAVDSAYQIGKISKEERDRLQLLSPEDLKKETAKSDSDLGAQQDNARMNAWMRIMAPGASDISTEAYNAGRYAGAPKGTPGRVAGLVGNIGAGLFDIARNVASGVGFSKMNAYENNYYNDILADNRRKYTNASQTQNVDNSETYRDGGLFETQHFELGGAAQEQAMPPEQGQPNLEQTAQQLVQQLKSLEAIDAYLQEKQVDEETYQTIMQIAEQMLGEKSAPESQEIPEMKGGGKFKHKVGDSIEFTHKGKTHRGIISKIENGQIYL